MNAQQLYDIWAPAGSVWSQWAKPALFAGFGSPAPSAAPVPPDLPPAGAGSGGESPVLAATNDQRTAYVVDLPGPRSVEVGADLARAGYRPVPLFNTAFHPAAVVSVGAILERLAARAGELEARGLPPEAPPAFLLDSRRLNPGLVQTPGQFDNRWATFPQDFPSASFLLSRGIQRVVLVHDGGEPDSLDDLAHVLLRWQRAGIEILRQDTSAGASPQPFEVRKPLAFRSLLYRALTAAGLRRNSAGGFGAIIPLATSSG
ncbi:MAG TPA: hypothetical protein VEL74_02520 [Thermoanaerobaculia bacterium]|nr:hypothetical protein [Thermoanaerobaculia bacterium]